MSSFRRCNKSTNDFDDRGAERAHCDDKTPGTPREGHVFVASDVEVVMMVMAEAYRNKPVEKSKNFISELK